MEKCNETVTMSLQKYEDIKTHIEHLYKKNEKLFKQVKENNKIYEYDFFDWHRQIKEYATTTDEKFVKKSEYVKLLESYNKIPKWIRNIFN